MKDTSIELDEQIGDVADLMDAYQTYSDMDLLNEALDVTYRILTVDEKGEIVIPGRTPNVVDCFVVGTILRGRSGVWRWRKGL